MARKPATVAATCRRGPWCQHTHAVRLLVRVRLSTADECEAGAGDFTRSRAPPSAAAKVPEASVCSARWPGGTPQEEEKGALPKLSWALISAVQLRSDG